MKKILAVAWTSLWLAGCTCGVNLEPLKFQCKQDSECGTGFVCRNERCAPGGAGGGTGGGVGGGAGGGGGGFNPKGCDAGRSPDMAPIGFRGTFEPPKS